MKSLLSTALAAAIGTIALMPSAFAANGTININGKILADTCTLTVGTSGNTVNLPTKMTSDFTGANQTVGATPFTLNLSGCDANAKNAILSFKSGTGNATDGNLKNTGGASGVEVQLTSAAGTINVNDDTNAPTIALTSGAGSVSLTAQYYTTATSVGAGLVTAAATVTYSYN